jgi:hypothetical protein
MFADAMSSGPRLPLGMALIAVPLPLVAAILAGLQLHDVIRAAGPLRAYFVFGIPLTLAVGTLLVWAAYFLHK